MHFDEWGLFNATNEVVTEIADDLSFLGHHGMAALWAGVKEFLGHVGVAFAFGHLAYR